MGSVAATIADNVITNNKFFDFYSTGLYVAGTKNTFVEGNTFSRPTRTSLGVGFGINFTAATSTLATISKNRVTNFFGGDATSALDVTAINFNGVDATNNKENIVVNNAIYNLGGLGKTYGLVNTNSDFVLYYHNSISIEDTSSLITGLAAGFYQTGLATGIGFKNNIIQINRGGTAKRYCIQMATAATTWESDYNNYFIDITKSTNFTGFFNNDKKTIKDWKTATIQDAKSFDYDPLYVDAKNGDLHPQFYLLDGCRCKRAGHRRLAALPSH